MPLFNVMVLNGNSYRDVAAIKDCTDHLSQAGKTDALFIADVFTKLLLEFDMQRKTAWTSSISTVRQMSRRPAKSWGEVSSDRNLPWRGARRGSLVF